MTRSALNQNQPECDSPDERLPQQSREPSPQNHGLTCPEPSFGPDAGEPAATHQFPSLPKPGPSIDPSERAVWTHRVSQLEERLATQMRVNDQLRFQPNPRPDHHPTVHGSPYDRPIVTPDKYDGSTSLSSYERYFRECAQINGWDHRTMGQFLAISLRGRAQLVLGAQRMTDFHAIMDTLKARFEPEGKDELYRIQLRNRRQGPKESLNDLAQDIRSLVDKAYPEMAEVSKDSLAKDCFLDALPDPDLRIRTLQMRPKTLQRALQDTTELEAINRAERERAGVSKMPQSHRVRAITELPDTPDSGNYVRSARTEKPEPALLHELAKSVSDLTKAISNLETQHQAQTKQLSESIFAAMQNLAQQLQGTPASAHPEPRPTPRERPYDSSRVRCYNCDEIGHIRPECPYPRSGNERGPTPRVERKSRT